MPTLAVVIIDMTDLKDRGEGHKADLAGFREAVNTLARNRSVELAAAAENGDIDAILDSEKACTCDDPTRCGQLHLDYIEFRTVGTEHLLEEYRSWSEDKWAAGFMDPSPDIVKTFREFLHNPPTFPVNDPLEDYEVKFLEEFERQEHAAD